MTTTKIRHHPRTHPPPLHTILLLLLLAVLSSSSSTTTTVSAIDLTEHNNKNNNKLQGLWGTLKSTSSPLRQSVKDSYQDLSDKGRFGVGAVVGFTASRVAVRSTVKAVKTVGAAYIAFEALEYAGILKEARANKSNQKLIAQTRDYLLRTMDGIRQDIRTNLNPDTVKKEITRSMEKDKPGTTGFGTGAFLGFVL